MQYSGSQRYILSVLDYPQLFICISCGHTGELSGICYAYLKNDYIHRTTMRTYLIVINYILNFYVVPPIKWLQMLWFLVHCIARPLVGNDCSLCKRGIGYIQFNTIYNCLVENSYASYKIRKLEGCACAGKAGSVLAG